MSLAFDYRSRSRGTNRSQRGGMSAAATVPYFDRPEPVVSPPTSESVPEWFFAVAEKIRELSTLESNWDGRGSAAVRSDVLAFAWGVLLNILPPGMPAPSIIPLGNGGVQLGWSGDTSEIEVEIPQPNEIEIYYQNRATGEELESAASSEFTELSQLLGSTFPRR
jgi:hypothetical protein